MKASWWARWSGRGERAERHQSGRKLSPCREVSEPSLWAGEVFPSAFQWGEATLFHEITCGQAASCSLLIWFPLISRNSLRAWQYIFFSLLYVFLSFHPHRHFPQCVSRQLPDVRRPWWVKGAELCTSSQAETEVCVRRSFSCRNQEDPVHKGEISPRKLKY